MSRFERYCAAADHRQQYLAAVGDNWTPERLTRYVELTRILQRARREYVLSDELRPGGMWGNTCWQCHSWAPMWAQPSGGREVCSKCGALDPLGHRDVVVERIERFENAELAERQARLARVEVK